MAINIRSRVLLCLLGLIGLTACSDDTGSPVSPVPLDPHAVPSFVGEWRALESSGDIAVSAMGDVLVSHVFEGIYEFSRNGTARGKWTPTSFSGDQLSPVYIEITADPRNSYYIVSGSPEPSRIVVFDGKRAWQREWEEIYDTTGWAGGVDQIAVGPSGDVYRLKFWEESVVKYTAAGEFEREWSAHGSNPGMFNSPGGIVATDEAVYISDTINNRILRFSTHGVLLDEFGSIGNGPLEFVWPTGLAIDGGVLYVVDRVNARVQKLTLNGEFLGVFSSEASDSGDLPLLIAVRGRHVYLLHETGLVRHFQYAD